MSRDFSSEIRLDSLRGGDRFDLVASADECDAIARRLGLSNIDRLDAHAVLERSGEVVRCHGRLQASLTQDCVVTGDAIASLIDEPFDLTFVPDPADANPDEEIELGSTDCDTVFYDGSTIPLGDAIADTLALSLDPYPRSASADAALREAGVMSEEEAGPFAALAALKGKLEN